MPPKASNPSQTPRDSTFARREQQQARTQAAAAAVGALSHPFLAAELPYKVNALPVPPIGPAPGGRVGYAHSHTHASSSTRSNVSSSSASLPTVRNAAITAARLPSSPTQRLCITLAAHEALGSEDVRSTVSTATSVSTGASSSNSRWSSAQGGSRGSSSWSTTATTPSIGSGSSSDPSRVSPPSNSTSDPSLSIPSSSTGASSGSGPGPRSSPPAKTPSPSSSSSLHDHSTSHFDSLMRQARMPKPGMAYFNARRVLWLDPPSIPPTPGSPSPSRVKLEALLNQPGAVESEEVWRAGLKNVWKGLVGGNQLRKRLPLSIVLKILQAGWLRDGTWPEGAVAPAWDDHTQQNHNTQSYQRRIAPHPDEFASGIPPGYTPSSGDQEQSGTQSQLEQLAHGLGMQHPYPYSEPTPPPGEPMRTSPLPLSSPMHTRTSVQDGTEEEMDVDDDDDDDDDDGEDAEAEELRRRHPGDSRHEGG